MKKKNFKANQAKFMQKTYRSKRVAPDTTDNFQCIMSACEDNCCRNTTWSISVDPDSYKKYESLKNDVGQRILSCIEDTGTMLKFKEFDDGKCPLMLESGLCYIHKELGEGYLCKTCKTYPRVTSYFNKKMEYWLSLSCPEVVRHVLYQDKILNLAETPVSLDGVPISKPLDTEKGLIRDMLEDIIAYPYLTVKEKLLYMSTFMRSIGKLSRYESQFQLNIKKTIGTYNDGLPEASAMLNQIVGKLGVIDSQMRNNVLQNLAVFAYQVAVPPKLHPEGIENAKYYTVMSNFHRDVGDGSAVNYLLNTFDSKIVPYVNSRPHVFINYLQYVLLSSCFLADSNDFAEAYAGFAGEFASMLVFACMFHDSETFGDEEMVVAMYLFHRRISHNQKLRMALAKYFSDNVLVYLLAALGGIE